MFRLFANRPAIGRFYFVKGFGQLLGEFGVEGLLVVDASDKIFPQRYEMIDLLAE